LKIGWIGLAGVLLAVMPGFAAAEDGQASDAIAIIGTGHVGGALGPRLAAAGHTVLYGSRHPEDPEVRALVAKSGRAAAALSPVAAASRAGVIILAVPWGSVESVVKSLGDLTGKVLVDTTNPLGHDDKTNLPVEFNLPMAGAELIQSWAPGAHVVKAFDTTNWQILGDPKLAGGPTSIPIAGDDPAAKRHVAALIRELRFEPVDAGELHNAKLIEGMALLYIRIKRRDGQDAYEIYLRRRPQHAAAPGMAPE
jgi:predicted dinucleotide-binding enzyme